MNFDFRSLVSTQPITGSSINTVPVDPSFTLLMYIVVCLLLVSFAVLYLARRFRLLPALYAAIMTTFFSAGIIYAAHADIGWITWLVDDIRMFKGLSTDEKLSKMYGEIWDFAREARSIIPDDYMLYSSDETAALHTEYFLLPHRKRAQSDYIVVFRDRQAAIDPFTGSFTRGDFRMKPVEPVWLFSRDTYILKRRSQ
jgi:hypothetical protein